MAVRHELVKKTASYFETDHWTKLKDLLVKHPDDVFHAHIYMDTSMEPETFSEVLRAYFRKLGMPIDRPIDLQTSNTGFDMLHGIHPSGTFHFDIAWKYEPGVMLQPMDPTLPKSKSNLDYWGQDEIDEFFSHFAFKPFGAKEKKEVEDYFKSETWKQACVYAKDRSIVHFHNNVELGVHPDHIMEEALKSFKQMGWKLQKTTHCLFTVRGGWKTGKVVFLLEEPRVMFDIAWKFNPDVTVVPSKEYFMLEDDPHFDVRYQEPYERFIAGKEGIVKFTPDELKEFEATVKV